TPGHLPLLHSVPTRRSSDLIPDIVMEPAPWPADSREPRCGEGPGDFPAHGATWPVSVGSGHPRQHDCPPGAAGIVTQAKRCHQRSEEHTSELQSRENLVCRL